MAIRWSKNSILSLKLRDGSYVLVQMLERNGWIAVLDRYSDTDEWDNFELNKDDVLFITIVTRAFISRSNLTRVKTVNPIAIEFDPNIPKQKINDKSGFRELTLWPDSEEPITILAPGGQGKTGLHTTGRDEEGKIIDEFQLLEPSEYHMYSTLETAHLSDYPNLNERLLLCKGMHTNFDPLRDLMFDYPLDEKCRPYCEIISGKVQIAKYGY